jgi:chromosome segregation ATPase
MSTYVTREEFDGRIRVLEGEVEGEKLVTRYILEQTQRNGDDLAALKARVEHLSSDVATVRGAITGHSALLNVLVQDVGGLRQEVGQMRRDMGQFRQEVGEMRRDMGQLREEVRQEIGEMRRDMGTMGADIAAIRVAVAPRGPVGGN